MEGKMRVIRIDEELLKVCPNIQLGCIQYSVKIHLNTKKQPPSHGMLLS
jgi:hypothetical protein